MNEFVFFFFFFFCSFCVFHSFIEFLQCKIPTSVSFFLLSCEYFNFFCCYSPSKPQYFFYNTIHFLPRFFSVLLFASYYCLLFACVWVFFLYIQRERRMSNVYIFFKVENFFYTWCFIHCVNLIFCCSSIWHVIFFFTWIVAFFCLMLEKKGDKK